MSCILTSLKRGYIGDYIGDYYIGVNKGDTRSLDYSSSRVYIGIMKKKMEATI